MSNLTNRVNRLAGKRRFDPDAEPATPLEAMLYRLNRMTPNERAAWLAEIDADLAARGEKPSPVDDDFLTRKFPEYWRRP